MNKPQFLAYLQARRDAGETLEIIGKSLAVSHVTVALWLSGKRNPSPMALMLAGEVSRRPLELASGLPEPQKPFSGARTHLDGGRSDANRMVGV